MVVHTDKRILWDPRSGSKFIVGGGSTITLYESNPDSSEIKHVTSQSDLQFMRCFQWSPDPAVEDLIAVGLSTGAVDLMRLESAKHTNKQVLTGGPRVSLPVKNSRPCNTLAFCDAQPNHLAVGLDKVRNDPSLIIWDISSTRSALSIDPSVDHTVNVDANGRSQPIPRSETNTRGDPRILQSHSPTDYISSVEFVPNSSYLLLAGISHRWLRLFDLRSPVAGAHNVPSKVHGIATDPIDPCRIGTFGDNVVTIWDSRRISHPLLTFTAKDASADGGRVKAGISFTTMQFSGARRGRLATLERGSSHVRFWDLQHAQATESSSDRSMDPSAHPNRTPRLSWTSPSSMLSWSSSGGSPTATEEFRKHPSNVVLADTRKTKDFNWHLSSFALVPSSRNHPLASHLMVVSKEGDLELYAIHDTPKYTSWSSRGDLAIGCGRSCQTVPGYDVRSPLNGLEPWNIEITDGLPVVNPEDVALQAYLNNGRRKSATPAPPFFGRGDEDGFPALSSTPASRSRERGTPKVPRNSAAASPATRKVDLPGDTSTGTVKAADLTVPISRPLSTVGGSSIRHSRRDKSVSKARKHAQDTIHKFVEQDISMIMRKRALMGYGLTNTYHNHIITQDDPLGNNTLSELWAWISFSKDVLSSQTIKHFGLDFSYEGLLGVWESTPKTPPPGTPEGDLQSALQSPLVSAALTSANLSALGLEYPIHRTTSRSKHLKGRSHASSAEPPVAFSTGKNLDGSGRASVQTVKSEQRELALQMCGWQVAPDDFANEIRRWEKEGKHSKAACWLVFTGQYSKALEVLMRSKDETHYVMTGTLVALTSHGASSLSRNSELKEHAERLIVRLQDPYFRAMLTLLTLREWSEVLEEEALPLRERLVVAFQFLDDKALSSYLRRTADRAVVHGDIEGIVITGLTKAGLDVLQNYVDSTGDVQTAAILSSYVCPGKLRDKRAEMWLEAYRDMLDGWRLFHHRCQLDIDRGDIIKRAVEEGELVPGWAPRQVMLRCNYCSKPIDVSDPSAMYKGRTTSCPFCGRALPRCSICLMTLDIIPDGLREVSVIRSQHEDTIDDAIVICQSCRHGGHASHLLEWFYGEDEDGARGHRTCPVADCDCRCADEL